jgi:hypothetical protein
MTEQHPQAHSSDDPQEESANNSKLILRLSYKVPFHIRLRSTVNSIARFLRIMQRPYENPEDADEFRPIKHGYRFVDSYRDRLTLLYSKPETQHLDRKRWMISEIRTYKDRKTRVKHEYLIATVYDQYGQTILFRIERRVRDSVIKSIGKRFLPGSHTSASSSFPPAGTDLANQEGVQVKKPSKFMKRALDQISIVKPSDLDPKQLPVEHIVFNSGHHVSLPELIILAYTISDYSREYHLTQSNCYWFCYIAIEYLKKHYPHTQPKLPGRKQQGTWSMLGGKRNLVYKDIAFEALDKGYEKFWNDFEQEVCFIYCSGNDPI